MWGTEVRELGRLWGGPEPWGVWELCMQPPTPRLRATLVLASRGGSTPGQHQPCTHICAQLCLHLWLPGSPWSPGGRVCALMGDGEMGQRGWLCRRSLGRGAVYQPHGTGRTRSWFRLGRRAVASSSFSAPSSSRRTPPPVPGGRWSWGGWGCEGGTLGALSLGGCPADPLSFPCPEAAEHRVQARIPTAPCGSGLRPG